MASPECFCKKWLTIKITESLLAEGLTPDFVGKTTGLSLNQVKCLEK